MATLLAIAAWWCGERRSALVFEPLLADWQHDLAIAKQRGRARYAMAVVAGASAYMRSLARCTMSGGWLPAAKTAGIAMLTFWVALKCAFILLWMMSLPSGRTGDVGSVQTQSFLLSAAGILVAPAMLPVLFLMRRDPRCNIRHAISGIAAGAALTAIVVNLTTPESLNRYFSTFSSFERQYQRDLANDRAGRVTYPATAVRQLRGPSTIEQRRANHARFEAWRAEQEAKQPPLTWQQQLRRMQPVALAALFGVMGWTLAGLGPVTYRRAVMWWMFIYGASLAFGVMPRALTGIPIRGVPYDYALPMFGAATLALVIASWRRTDEGRT